MPTGNRLVTRGGLPAGVTEVPTSLKPLLNCRDSEPAIALLAGTRYEAGRPIHNPPHPPHSGKPQTAPVFVLHFTRRRLADLAIGRRFANLPHIAASRKQRRLFVLQFTRWRLAD
jgi:hypothetical protein